VSRLVRVRAVSEAIASVRVRAADGAPPPRALEAPRAALAAARAELGLAVDRPIVMVGHQAAFWHAGIAAKLAAAGELADRLGAQLVWLSPDQDAHEPTTIAYPACTPEGRLRRAHWLASVDQVVRHGTPVCERKPIRPTPPPRRARTQWPHHAVEAGLVRARDALERHEGQATLGGQFTAAALELAADAMGVRVDAVVTASGLAQTRAFGLVVDRVRADARGCVGAYNAAARAHEGARVRALEDGQRLELPLWDVPPSRPRSPMLAGEAARGRVLPRGLLLTGLARALLCDVWVTGLGGLVYDRVTRDWFASWSGVEGWELSCAVLATATVRLPLRDGPQPDPDRAARAAWRAHHAAHHPGALGLDGLARQREGLVAQIAAAPRRSAERSRLFDRLRSLTERARREGADRLAELQEEAARERELLRDADVVLERTWPFPLHEPAVLADLAARVRQAAGELA